MSSASGIEARLDDILRHCTRCGGCLEVCPSFRATGDESQSARGRATLLEAVSGGRLGLTGGLRRRLSTCLDCGACQSACPAGVDLPAAIGLARQEMDPRAFQRLAGAACRRLAVADGPAPALLKVVAAMGAALPAGRRGALRPHAIKSLLPQGRGPVLSGRLPEISPAHRPGPVAFRVTFFPGCAVNLVYPETGLAAVRVMNAAGADVIIPRGLKCCGRPHRSLGDRDAAGQGLLDNLDILAAIDADAIVTVCSTCALTLREELPRLAGADRTRAAAVAAKVKDIHEWLAGNPLLTSALAASAGGPKSPGQPDSLKTGRPSTVTWHDPCHMRWGLGLTEEPRRIIRALPGVEYAETGGAAACCGGGGLFSLFHYGLAAALGARRIESIANAGAEVVATGCPSCQAQLAAALLRAGSRARVMHTVELVAAALPAAATPQALAV